MIEPRIRLLSAIFALAGIWITSDASVLFAGYCVLLTIVALRKELKGHILMITTAFIPILIMLVALYKYILPASVITQSTASPFSTTLRIMNMSTVFYLTLKMRPDELPSVLRTWGLRGDALLIVTSSLISVVDLTKRADRILTARMARGYFQNRFIITKLIQLPFIVRPLVAASLLSAIERSDSWHQKLILAKPLFIPSGDVVSRTYSALVLVLALVWITATALI